VALKPLQADYVDITEGNSTSMNKVSDVFLILYLILIFWYE